MPTLFEPIRVGNLELDNRVIMAPMTRSRTDDAGVQPAYAAEYYRQRSSAGLIITIATAVPRRLFRQRRFYQRDRRETAGRRRRGRHRLRQIVFSESRSAGKVQARRAIE